MFLVVVHDGAWGGEGPSTDVKVEIVDFEGAMEVVEGGVDGA